MLKGILKRIMSVSLVVMAVQFLSAVAFAASTTPDVATLMGDGMQSVQGDVMSVLAVAIPVIIAITGITVAIRFGLKYLKKVGQ